MSCKGAALTYQPFPHHGRLAERLNVSKDGVLRRLPLDSATV
jgi:hypothetical protein